MSGNAGCAGSARGARRERLSIPRLQKFGLKSPVVGLWECLDVDGSERVCDGVSGEPLLSRTPRILYSFPGRLGRTGIGTTAWHQAQGLVDEGLEVHVYCGSCERPIQGAAKMVQTLRPAGLRIPYRLMGDVRAWRGRRRTRASAPAGRIG